MSTYGRGSITLERGKYRVRIPNGQGGYDSIGTADSRTEAEGLLDAAHLERAELGATLCLLDYGLRVIDRWVAAGQRDAKPTRSRWTNIVGRAPFAKMPIRSVERVDVRDWIRALPEQQATRSVVGRRGKRKRVALGRTLSWQSCKHALGLVCRVLGEAVEDGLITENVARGVKLQRRQERAEGWTWLTTAELGALWALPLSLEQRTALSLAVYQGLRQGEIAALDWSGVDLEAGWLVIAGSWGTATKSGRVRRIPLLAPARAALLAWRPDPDSRTGIVLPGAEGKPYGRGYDWGWGDRRSGPDVPTRAGVTRRVRFHDLRHTCAAHLISGSWGRAWKLAEVRAFLGHTEESVTARYAHLDPAALQAVARETATYIGGRERGTVAPNLPRDLPQPDPASIQAAAEILSKVIALASAGDARFERAAFGSGGLSASNEFTALSPSAAGVRQVSRAMGVLEVATEGRKVDGAELEQLAIEVLSDERARLALRVLAGDRHQLDRGIELATLLTEQAAAERGRAAR